MNLHMARVIVLLDHQNMNYTTEQMLGMGLTNEMIIQAIAEGIIETGVDPDGLHFHLTEEAIARLRAMPDYEP